MICYPVKESGPEEGFVPVMVGRDICFPAQFYGPAQKSICNIHFCLSGKGTLMNRDGLHAVKGGDLFIIRPGETYTTTADSVDPWRYAWIDFKGKRAEFFENVPSVLKIPVDMGIRLCELAEAGENSADIFIAFLYELVYHLSAGSAVRYDRVAEVRRFIKYKNKENLNAMEIAEKFHFTRGNLHELFKARYGVSVKEYIVEVRMQRARRLLMSGKNVSETAYTVGYSNEFNFSRAFKQYYGVAPRELKPAKQDRPVYD